MHLLARSLLLCLPAFVLCSLLRAQTVNDTLRRDTTVSLAQTQPWRIDAVEVGMARGMMLVTDQYQRAWTTGRALTSAMVTLRHHTLRDAPTAIAHDYNFPTWGLSLQWVDLSHATMQKQASPWWGQALPVNYPSHGGQLFSLVGSFSRPLQRKTWGEWGYALEEGLAVSTRPYHRENNVDNELIGSPLLFHFGASVYGEVQLAARWKLRVDFAFRHVSNGATSRPNKGANMWLPTLAVQYDLSANNQQKTEPAKFLRTHKAAAAEQGAGTTLPSSMFVPRWYVRVEGSVGVRTLLEDWLRTQYATAPEEADYRTAHFRKYVVGNGQIDVMRRYARRWALGIGADVFFLPYVHALQKYVPNIDDAVALGAQMPVESGKALSPTPRFSPFSLGLAVKHESFYGRLSSYVHLGYYLFRKTGHLPSSDETPYYERVGLRYHFGKQQTEIYRGLTLSVGIKAHKLKADFAEIGIGWAF